MWVDVPSVSLCVKCPVYWTFEYMGLNLDEILNYIKYSTMNANRKYQEIQIENMFRKYVHCRRSGY